MVPVGRYAAAHVKHWKNILSGDCRCSHMPTTIHASPYKRYGARTPLHLPPRLASHLRGISPSPRSLRVSSTHAAYALLLMRVYRPRGYHYRLPVCQSARSRTGWHDRTFVNSLPIRLNLGGDPGGRELIAQVSQGNAGCLHLEGHSF